MRAPEAGRLIDTYQLATGAHAVGLSLDGRPVAASNRAGATFDDWQFVCGQGPSLDAYRTGQCVEVAETEVVAARWALLTEALGVWPCASLLAVPVGTGRAVGALTFQRTTSGALTPGEYDAAVACARHAAGWLHGMLEPASTVALGHYDLISCATGIVMARTGLASDDATAIIRAHAYTSDDDLTTILHDIIDLGLSLA